MFLDQTPRVRPRLSLFAATEPKIVTATKDDRVLHKVTFEIASQTRENVISAALIWNTNSYFIDVEKQTFVVNGGNPIRFEDWHIDNPQLLLVRTNKQDFNTVTGKSEEKSIIGYFLGIENRVDSEPRMIAAHISPDGSEFRFQTTR